MDGVDYSGPSDELDCQRTRHAIPDVGLGTPPADHNSSVGMRGPDGRPYCPGSSQSDRPGFPVTDRRNCSLDVDTARQRLYNAWMRHSEIEPSD